ncbi:hypothetical protein GW17_00051415 [Ensete ventricosum]|nr:hypothetical protein GW17_00051415 [Ensete ventricosum]
MWSGPGALSFLCRTLAAWTRRRAAMRHCSSKRDRPPQRRWRPDPHGGSHGSQRGTIVRSRCKGECGSSAVSSSTDGSTTGGEPNQGEARFHRRKAAGSHAGGTTTGGEELAATTCAAGASATPLPEEAGTHAGRASTEETTASIGDAGSTSELKIPREERRLRALEL